jgi:hypothetical protein
LGERISEEDLKKSVAKVINSFVQPVRDYFETNERAKELLAKIKTWNQAQEDKKKTVEPTV